MTSRSEDRPAPVLEPDLEQARRTAGIAHSVIIMLKELGLPDRMDDDLASLSTDLGDLWGAQAEFTSRLEGLLKDTDRDTGAWERVGDCLVDLRSSVDHMAWHLRSVRGPLNKLARYAYRQANRRPE